MAEQAPALSEVPAPPDPPTTETPTVMQALARVIADMPAIGKTEENKEQGYKFRGIESMTAAAGPLLGRHGVVIVPQVRERIYEERTTRNNRPMYVVHLRVRFRIYGPAGDHVTAEAWGEGTDMGDKATNKAMTGAFKYMLGQLLVIGDSASDADHHDPPEAKGKHEDAAAWWLENWGEGGAATHDEARAQLRAQLGQLPAALQTQFKEWRTHEDRQYSVAQGATPSTPDEMAAMTAKVQELAAGAGLQLQGSEQAPTPPQEPADDKPAPPTPEAPEPAQQPAEPPTDPATIPDQRPADMDEAIAMVTAMGKPAVVEMLRNNGQPTNGNEDTLRRRLVEYLVTAQPELAQADRTQEDVPTGGKL